MTIPAGRQASYWIDSTSDTDYQPLAPGVTRIEQRPGDHDLSRVYRGKRA